MEKMSNGCCQTSTGWRQIAFMANGEICPVSHAVESGYRDGRATYQDVSDMAVIYSFVWGHGDPGTLYTGMAYGNETARMPLTVDTACRFRRLCERYPWLDEFLSEHGRTESYLPVNREEWQSTRVRERRRSEFREKFGVELPDDIVGKSADWGKVHGIDFDPDTYTPSVNTAVGALVSVDQRDIWYSSDGKGRAVRIDAAPSESHRDNGAGGGCWTNEGRSGLPGWRDRPYLVRIDHGVCGLHTTWGSSVKVYRT